MDLLRQVGDLLGRAHVSCWVRRACSTGAAASSGSTSPPSSPARAGCGPSRSLRVELVAPSAWRVCASRISGAAYAAWQLRRSRFNAMKGSTSPRRTRRCSWVEFTTTRERARRWSPGDVDWRRAGRTSPPSPPAAANASCAERAVRLRATDVLQLRMDSRRSAERLLWRPCARARAPIESGPRMREPAGRARPSR